MSDSLGTAAGQLDTGVNGEPAVEELVGALGLGVGLLQQGGPVLHVRVGLHVDQTTLPGRKQVINHDFYPPAEPEAEMEYSAIIFMFCESLVWRDNMIEQGGAVCDGTECRHKPGIKALEIEIFTISSHPPTRCFRRV